MTFTRKPGTLNSSAQIKQFGKVSVYPNPAKKHLYIHSGFLFHTTEVFNIYGRRVLLNHKDDTESSMLELNLANGLYLLKISGDRNFACSKLMIDL
jgi:hypothetical protein